MIANKLPSNIESKYFFTCLACIISSVLIDLYIFHAAIVAIFLILFALPSALIFYIYSRKTTNKNGVISSLKLGLIFIFTAILSLVIGKVHDFLITKNAYGIMNAVDQYYAINKKYPSPQEGEFSRSKFFGYPVHYINTDGINPYIVFDKFNYRRQKLDIKTRHLNEDYEI